MSIPFDPALDLRLERVVDAPRHLLWKGWTQPEYVKQWFTPAPWKTVECDIDLRPGGIFRNLMRGPEGQEIANTGCYLEVVENERLVWTASLLPGFRPRPSTERHPYFMTGIIQLESVGNSTKYTATALHGDAEARDKHEQVGFLDGWSKALDQLVALTRSM